ncbi:MAG: hypothetical protein NC078_00330 [Ruminococcus sp.]|nr:hypothetical protein [Ruminococcus sp.]
MKKAAFVIGIILILLGVRGAYSVFTLTAGFGFRSGMGSIIITGAIAVTANITCGIILLLRRSLKAACTAMGAFLAAEGVYYIAAAFTAIPLFNALSGEPDSQLPGLNSLASVLGLLSVYLMLAEGALSIAGAAFGIAFMRKGRCFIPAVVFTVLPVVFLIAAHSGDGILHWLLFLAALIYTKRTAKADLPNTPDTYIPADVTAGE